MPVERARLRLESNLVAKAAAVLGTTTPTETVRASLEQSVRRAHLRRLAEWKLPDPPWRCSRSDAHNVASMTTAGSERLIRGRQRAE